MGSTFLTNDLQDITGGVSWKMLKNKINVMTNAGLQKNNLNNQKAASMLRTVYNVNLNFLLSPKFTINTQFANYNTTTQTTRFTQSGVAGNTLESLFYLQVNRSMGVGLNYNFKRPSTNQNLIGNISIQNASNTQKNNSSFHIYNISYLISWPILNLSLTSSWNMTNSSFPTRKVTNTGPTLSISKQLLKNKVRIMGSFNTLVGLQEGNKVSQVYNCRTSLSWTPIVKHVCLP